MFYFGNRRSRESDNRLEAKSDRLLSEQGIDQAQFGYHEEEEVQGCGLTAYQRSMPDRSDFAARWHA
jgi:hypothetical protein